MEDAIDGEKAAVDKMAKLYRSLEAKLVRVAAGPRPARAHARRQERVNKEFEAKQLQRGELNDEKLAVERKISRKQKELDHQVRGRVRPAGPATEPGPPPVRSTRGSRRCRASSSTAPARSSASAATWRSSSAT
jgi:hypothetical protein